MVDSRLPPTEEARVRTAALVAAQRMSWTVPRAVLDYIVATSDPRQGPAALEMRAAGIVEYVSNHPDRPDFANANDRQAQGFFRMIHGQVVSRFGGLPWALALAREEEGSDYSSGSTAYAELGGDIGSITPSNFTRSHYHRCGLDYATFDALRREGFNGQNIINAARDARALGFRANDREAMRDHALIDRYSIDARGVNAGLQDFRARLDADQEYRDLARRLAAAEAAGASEADKQALRDQVAARESAILGQSTLHPRLTDPAETPEARAAAERRRHELIRRRRGQLGIEHLMGEEASRDITDEQLPSQPVILRTTRVVPGGSAGNLLATVTPTPGAGTGTRDANAGGLLATVSAAPAAGTVTPDANAGNLLTTVATAAPDANADGEGGQGPNRPGPRLTQNTTVRTPTLTG